MTPFHIILALTLVLFGLGLEHMRIRYALWRKKQRRRKSLGVSFRPSVTPVWPKWSPEYVKALRK